MAKSKAVCIIGSVVLTPVLMYAGFLGVVLVLAVAMHGRIPEPPPQHPSGIVSGFVDTLSVICLVVVSICIGRSLFRKCRRQPNEAGAAMAVTDINGLP